MKTPRKLSPARSQGPVRTPIRHKHHRTLSVSSARSQASVRLSTLIKQNRNVDLMSPLSSRRSILTDNTQIEEPRRNSWWKKLGENSRDVIEFLEENKVVEPINIIEELDMEILSQEQKNYTIDLPESSGSESIHSIVIPQRKIFPQKKNLHQKKFGQIISTRETLGKLYKPNTSGVDPAINAGTRELFPNKKSSKPIFPAALLNISPNKTAADKTRELAAVELKAQVRTIFGNRATKRKNIFTNFIVSESEDDIPEIQAKVFKFQKKIDARRRGSSSSRGIRERSPTSSITTDIEMDDWKMLPSSTMVENQLEIMIADGQSSIRTRLSNLKEIESEAGSNATKQSNKSASSKEADKSRKSKTFTKEKAPALETSITTKNKPEVAQYDDEEIFNNNRSMTTRNKSKVSQNGNELTLVENKSRKSKTFIKEKELDLETSMTDERNKSKTYFPTLAQNKSKIADENLSQFSVKIRSKKGSPNTSHVIEEPDFNDNPQISNKNTSKNIATSSTDKSKNKVPNEAPVADHESDDDDDLNFTLEYDDENNEEISENIQDKSERRASKCMSLKVSTANVSKMNKVVDESAELESTQEKSNSMKILNKASSFQAKDTSKVVEKDQIQENEELETDKLDATNNSNSNNDANEMDVDKNVEFENDCKDVQDETISQAIDEKGTEESEVENNDNSMIQNGSEVNASKEQDEENDEQDEKIDEQDDENNEEDEENDDEDEENDEQDEENNEDEENDEMQEREESHNVQNLSEPENESQVVEDENEDDNNESEEEHNESDEIEKEQNDSQEEQQNESGVEQNESQEIEQDNVSQEIEDEDQNISKEKLEDESDMEQNKRGIEENKEQNESGLEDNEEQNESGIEDNDEQNESEDENEEESEGVADSDNENDEPNQSQEVANESDNEDTNGGESDQEIDTPNVSHDTTGRNRKKNESPEVILRDSNNHLDSFDVQSRNTSISKTEIIKSMHISRSLAPLRQSTGFSDGANNSSAEGSGWDSHRTTRKTLRQTFGKDFTPRKSLKSLRALVMEKTAKRQTQHNDIASITVKFPQANSTELTEMSNRFDDGVDEIQESNHEVSLRTRQTMLENYLDEISKKNTETRLKIEEAVRESLKARPNHVFKVPAKPFFARSSQAKPKPTAKKQGKSKLFLGELPAEVIDDFKYKPPKRFGPGDAAWITKRLYKYLETKLEPKYDYKARLRAEKLVENIYHFSKEVRRRREPASVGAVDALKQEMARLDIVKTHFDFYEFFHEFMPREVRIKVIPDIVNKISLPRHGVFADIL